MEKSELQATLAKVQSELADAQTVDQDTRQLLTALTNDIQRLLEKEAPQPTDDAEEPLSQQVRDTMLQFETEHPKLTTALNQVADALSNLGI